MVQGITDHFAINDCNATYKAFTGDSATQWNSSLMTNVTQSNISFLHKGEI
jgi:hypothetical protein